MHDDILIETISVGPLETNCYVVAAGAGTSAAVIDPGDDVDKILKVVNGNGLKVTHIINTHGHYDHIGADSALAATTGAKIYIHSLDASMIKDPQSNLSLFLNSDYEMNDEVVKISDGEELVVGGLKLKIIHTPGHTPGGVCLYSKDEGIVFVGDTLFADSVGRTDFLGGSMSQLIKSIKEKLCVLPDETVVYPGHGPITTIAQEKAHNQYLR